MKSKKPQNTVVRKKYTPQFKEQALLLAEKEGVAKAAADRKRPAVSPSPCPLAPATSHFFRRSLMASSQKHLLWQKHIRTWQGSGLSQASYCQTHNLALGTFGYWRKRVKNAADVTPRIIPVQRELPGLGVQLRSPGGWHLTLPASLGMEFLRVLVATLP